MKKYLKKVKGPIILMFFIYGMLSAFNIVRPVLGAKMVVSITEFNIKATYILITLFSVLSILSAFTEYIATKVLRNIQETLLYDIRYDIVQRVFRLKTSNFDKRTTGEFQERIKSDPEDVFSVFSIVQYNLFNIITEVFILFYILYVNIYLGLIFCLGIFLIYYLGEKQFKIYKRISKETKAEREKSGTLINEILKGIKDIKQLGISEKVNHNVGEALDNTTKLETKLTFSSMNVFILVEIMKIIITFIVFTVGIYLVKNNLLLLTNFLIVIFYRNEVFSLANSYASLKEHLIKYNVAKNRIAEIFDDKLFPVEDFGVIEIENIKGDIEFKNVSFAYENKKVIDNLSFKISSHEDVAIVGKSGAGKTTIFNLITKSYDNYEGLITIDGFDIKKLSKKTLNNSISIISQNPYLFNLSIKDNLKLVNNKATKEDIIRVCKIARIDEYIKSFPKGYDQIIGEGGVKLSGGQKQRLAIARALLKNSKIILFDEATSALDNKTQEEVQEAIKAVSKDRVVITIAHRLSTIIDAKKIFLLEEGNVIASGDHKTLMKTSRKYRELYKKQ